MGSQSHYSNLVSSQTSSPVESTGTSSQKEDVIIFILKEQKMKKKINVDLLGMYQYHVFLQKKPQNNNQFVFFFFNFFSGSWDECICLDLFIHQTQLI